MTTSLTSPTPNPIPITLRLGTMLLDHFLICFIGIPPIIVLQYLINSGESLAPSSPYVMMPLFIIYFCKDCIKGQSLAKRILKLTVVDNKLGSPATPLQCLVRNLLIILWPVEVIVALFNQRQRIGDRLAGTRLSYFNPEMTGRLNVFQLIIAALLATVFTYLLIQIF